MNWLPSNSTIYDKELQCSEHRRNFSNTDNFLVVMFSLKWRISTDFFQQFKIQCCYRPQTKVLRRLCFYRCLCVHGGGGMCVVALGGGMHGCSGGMRGCSRGACMVAPRGVCMVAPRGGMHGCSRGVCMVAPRGMCGCSGGCAWLLPGGHARLLWGGGHAWLLQGACMVALGGMCGCSRGGGMCGCSGECMVAWGGGMHGIWRDMETRSMSGR